MIINLEEIFGEICKDEVLLDLIINFLEWWGCVVFMVWIGYLFVILEVVFVCLCFCGDGGSEIWVLCCLGVVWNKLFRYFCVWDWIENCLVISFWVRKLIMVLIFFLLFGVVMVCKYND